MNELWKVAIDYGLYPNLPLWYGIGAPINDLIIQKYIILIFKAFNNHYNYNINFKAPILMKFCLWNFTYIRRQPLKTIFPIKAFEISWSHGNRSYELKFLFIITLCYNNVIDCEFLRL